MYAPDQLTAKDARGNMSNYICVEPWTSNVEDDIPEVESPRGSYGQHIPDPNDDSQ